MEAKWADTVKPWNKKPGMGYTEVETLTFGLLSLKKKPHCGIFNGCKDST